MARTLIGVLPLLLLFKPPVSGQTAPHFFAGAVAGIATLSADGRSEITPDGVDVSMYKPENGPTVNLLLGIQFHEYLAFQANYIGNRNDVTLTSVRATDTGPAYYEQPRAASQHAVVGDVLAYFRGRRSVLRPYLSVGLGLVRLETRMRGEGRARSTSLPPARAGATNAVLRVAVGLDVALGGNWSARYSFSESLSVNPISADLSPPGRRNLANFQNLFGVVRGF
jgi:hypothetical protein